MWAGHLLPKFTNRPVKISSFATSGEEGDGDQPWYYGEEILGMDVYDREGRRVGWVGDLWQCPEGNCLLMVSCPKSWFWPLKTAFRLYPINCLPPRASDWSVLVDDISHYVYESDSYEDVTDVCEEKKLTSYRDFSSESAFGLEASSREALPF